jgi:large subunit ribosomal protein L22
MPKFGYSAQVDEKACARAMGKELRASPKHAGEVCRAIKGMKLEGAKEYLQAVIDKKRAIPYRRYRKKLAHRKNLQKWDAGRYPVKAARAVLEVLGNVEANASYKGMTVEKLKIIHASAQRGIIIPGFRPRAFGRATPFNTPTTNVEIIVKEAA